MENDEFFLSYIWTVSRPTSQIQYRGSPKHKNRPARGPKGTLCPEWTHRTEGKGLGDDMFAHPWGETEAARLFASAFVHAGTGRRYATSRGIAFEAKPTDDGTWHGYPIPWEQVPDQVRRQWLAEKLVTGRQIKKFLSFDKRDIEWPLVTD